MGLNDAYGIVRSNLSCKDPLPSLLNVYVLLTSKEIGIGRTQSIESTTFKVNIGGFRGKDHNKKLRCDHCKKLKHMKDNCFEIIRYPTNWQGKKKRRHIAYPTNSETKEKKNVFGSFVLNKSLGLCDTCHQAK